MSGDLTPEQKGYERRERADDMGASRAAYEAWLAEFTGQQVDLPVGRIFDWPMSGDALALTKAGVIA